MVTRQSKLRIQIVSRYLPIPNASGSATHMLDFVEFLHRKGCELEYVFLGSPAAGELPGEIASVMTVRAFRRRIPASRRIYQVLPSWLKTLWRMTKRGIPALRGYSGRAAFTASATPREIEFVSVQALRFNPDVVIADYSWLGEVLRPLAERVLKVIFVHDLKTRMQASLSQIGLEQPDSPSDREIEAAQLQAADVLLALQPEDIEALARLAPNKEIIRMSMSAVTRRHPPGKQVAGRCLYVSSAAPENVSALSWLLSEPWIEILRRHPNAKLHVCGTVCEAMHSAPASVALRGRLDDLGDEYAAAEVCLVPHYAAGGVKIKMVEALSHGRASVATRRAIEGLEEAEGAAILVANGAPEFADAVCRLLGDVRLRQRMEQAAECYVSEHLVAEKVYGGFWDRICRSSGRDRVVRA